LIPAAAALAAAAWLAPDALRLPPGPSVGYRRAEPPPSGPASRVVVDDRPVFDLDAARQWRIDLGRGSGLDGLETVTVNQSGRLLLYQRTDELDGTVVRSRWETAADVLPPEAVASVLAAATSNQLTLLRRAYHADVYDGTQWVLRIRQGEHDKAVYFNNHFPERVVRFATKLDEIIATTVGPRLRWRPVVVFDGPPPEHELWESIRR
jgi:hypothetical protein